MAGFVIDNRRNRSSGVGLFQSVFARIFYERCIQLDLALDSNDLSQAEWIQCARGKRSFRQFDHEIWEAAQREARFLDF